MRVHLQCWASQSPGAGAGGVTDVYPWAPDAGPGLTPAFPKRKAGLSLAVIPRLSGGGPSRRRTIDA